MVNKRRKIHSLGLSAYHSVLRAFTPLYDTISPDQESLLAQLRKEFHVSDTFHRKSLRLIEEEDDEFHALKRTNQENEREGSKKEGSEREGDAPTQGLNSVARQSRRPESMEPSRSRAADSLADNKQLLVNRRFWIRWPKDNKFYEVLVTDFNKETNMHRLEYESNDSPNVSWEWIDITTLDEDDVQFLEEDEDDNKSV